MSTATLEGLDWRTRGACSPATAHLFDFGVLSPGPVQFLSGDNIRAIALCRECPVQRLCLDDAVHRRPYGDPTIAGGHLVWDGRVMETSTLRAEIDQLHRAGLTDKQIATRTRVHPRTVQRHLYALRTAVAA